MSVLNKKPFIQTLIDSLSTDEKKSLLNCINGLTTVRKYSLIQRDLSISTPIESIQLETKTKIYNGYKIYKSNKITFLMYNVGQEINMYQVSYPYYEKELKGRIKESLSIDELRRVIENGLIEAGEIEGYVTEEELKEKAAIVIETENITGLSKTQLDSLKPGDIVNKITGNTKYSYHVSYKGEGAGQGICLTYCDASIVETVSYDRSGNDWVYNSTDVSNVGASGGGKLYNHLISLEVSGVGLVRLSFLLQTASAELIDTVAKLAKILYDMNATDTNHSIPVGDHYAVSGNGIYLYSKIYASSESQVGVYERVITGSIADSSISFTLGSGITRYPSAVSDTVTEL